MDFSLSEEQRLLRESVDKLVAAQCDVETHRKLSHTPLGYDPARWAQFAELGWLAVPFEESYGGLDGGAVDMAIMGESLGKGLVREPWLSTVVTCGGLLRLGGTEAQKAHFLPPLIDGSRQWAFAHAEEHSGYDFGTVATSATVAGDAYVLTGKKIAVLNGHAAHHIIVSARLAGARSDRDGLALFIVDASQDGVRRENFATVDGSRAALLEFTNVQVDAANALGVVGKAYPLMERVVELTIVAIAAEALGAMQVLLDTTVEYTKTRKQFGQPIGSFQALQHRMADMYIAVEETRSLLSYAAIQIDAGADDVAAACMALKVKVAQAGKFVSQQALQLHGGIGMSDELVVGHHFKRLLALGMLFGDEEHSLQRYIDVQGFACA